jgi:hypothetical protein
MAAARPGRRITAAGAAAEAALPAGRLDHRQPRPDSIDGNNGRDRIVALGGEDHIRLDHGTVDAGAGVLVARADLGDTTLRLDARGPRALAARHRLGLTVRTRGVSRTFGHLATAFRTVVTRPRP